MMRDRPTLMMVTPGITRKRYCACPIGTEGELSAGPSHINPHRSEEERRIVERIKEKRQERREETKETATETMRGPLGPPMQGRDPYLFDDIDRDTFEVPALDDDLGAAIGTEAINPFNNQGLRF